MCDCDPSSLSSYHRPPCTLLRSASLFGNQLAGIELEGRQGKPKVATGVPSARYLFCCCSCTARPHHGWRFRGSKSKSAYCFRDIVGQTHRPLPLSLRFTTAFGQPFPSIFAYVLSRGGIAQRRLSAPTLRAMPPPRLTFESWPLVTSWPSPNGSCKSRARTTVSNSSPCRTHAET